MSSEKADYAPGTGWYLMTGGGDLIARVQAGTLLGEDPTGELSFKPGEALVTFTIGPQGRLGLEAASAGYELEVDDAAGTRSACVEAHSRAQICFPHHTLYVDTDFVAHVPSRHGLKIAVVPVAPGPDTPDTPPTLPAATDPPDAGSPDPVDPATVADRVAGDQQELERVLSTLMLVPEATLEEVHSTDDEEPFFIPADVSSARARSARSRFRVALARIFSGARGIVAAVVLALAFFVYEARIEAPAPTDAPADGVVSGDVTAPMDEEVTRAGVPATDDSVLPDASESLGSAAPARVEVVGSAATATEAARETPVLPIEAEERQVVPVTVAEPPAGATAAPPVPDLDLSTVELDIPTAKEVSPAAPPKENVELLLGVNALLESEQLPEKSTIDLAMQSLKALLVAYPDDPDVRDGLERLTGRLVSEARLAFERGDLIMAGRLIEQASSSGVSQDEVRRTIQDFSTPRVTPPGATATEPAGTDTTPPASASRSAGSEASGSAAGSAVRTPPASNESVGRPAPRLRVTLDVVSPEPRSEPSEPALEAPVPTLEPTTAAPALPRVPSGVIDGDGDHEGLYPFASLRPIEQAPPEYPSNARRGGTTSVDVELTVERSGTVRDVRVVSTGGRYFDREAIRAVAKWRFYPVLFDGRPVAVRTAVRLTFRD